MMMPISIVPEGGFPVHYSSLCDLRSLLQCHILEAIALPVLPWQEICGGMKSLENPFRNLKLDA